MAYSFLFGGSTKETPESIKRKRDLAMAIMGASPAPKNIGEGLNALGSGIVAGVMNRRANKAEDEGRASADTVFKSAMQGQLASQIMGAAPSSMLSPGINPASGGASGGSGSYRDAIASIESAGSGDYKAVGPTHPKMGRALGRYQIMEANIGPWSREVLGREVTPDEFMANPELQDVIFDGKFQGYVQQFGPEGAAQAWFAGPGGVGKTNRKDSLGTDVGTYGRKFMSALGPQTGPTEVASLDPAAGTPPQTAAGAVNAMAAGGGAVLADESQYSPEDRARLAALRGPAPSSVPYSGPGARIDTPTAVYDDKRFRMEPAGQQPPPPSLSDEVAAFEQTPEYRAQFPGMNAQQPPQGPIQNAPQQQSAIPPQFQGSQQLANAQGGIMPALMGGSPASPGQVAQAQAVGQQQPPQQPPAQARPDKMALLQALSNPWLSQEQKAVLQTLYQQQEQEEQAAREQQVWMQRQQYEQEAKRNDPAYQIGLEKSRIELEDAKKPKRQPLINAGNGNVYDPNDDKWLSAPSGSGDGSFRFNGNSVEAQALNGLMESGQLTPEQAQQLAAGKTISGPNGEIIFLTPQGVFGQSSAGGQPQQMSGSQQSSSQPPRQQIQPQTPMPGQTTPGGNIQITPPKVTVDEKEAATFADRMNTSGGLIDQFERAGLGVWDQAVRGNDYIPDFLENWMVSDDFQNFDQARRDFINAQLRRESGAVISAEEFDNANKQYFPQPGDTKEVLEQKRRNRQTVMDGMKRSAGPTYGNKPGAENDPLGIR